MSCGVAFIVDGGSITQRRVETCEVVTTNVALDDMVERAIVVEGAAVDDVGLHGVKKGFDEGVVADLAWALHALRDPEGRQACPESIGRVFHAAVGVKDQVRSGPLPEHGAIESNAGQGQIPPEADRKSVV